MAKVTKPLKQYLLYQNTQRAMNYQPDNSASLEVSTDIRPGSLEVSTDIRPINAKLLVRTNSLVFEVLQVDVIFLLVLVATQSNSPCKLCIGGFVCELRVCPPRPKECCWTRRPYLSPPCWRSLTGPPAPCPSLLPSPPLSLGRVWSCDPCAQLTSTEVDYHVGCFR